MDEDGNSAAVAAGLDQVPLFDGRPKYVQACLDHYLASPISALPHFITHAVALEKFSISLKLNGPALIDNCGK